jgi:hypothetical protein
MLVAMTLPASAQTPPTPTTVSEDTAALLAPIPHSRKNPLIRPDRDYRGLSIGDFMFYPTITIGGTFDDNLVWSSRKPISATGFRVNPTIVAQRDTGIHKTTIYGELDARFYPNVRDGDTVSGQAGLSHVWEVQRDLVVKTQVDYRRKTLHVGGVAMAPGGDFTTLAMPLTYNQGAAMVSVQKSFDKLFVGISAEASKTVYDDLSAGKGRTDQHYRDSMAATATLRGGVWVSPAFYLFAETAGTIRDYGDDGAGAKGYRAVAGLGSDRISLFRGEVYAGVQQQFYESGPFKMTTVPVFGGKLFWYPTRDLTLRASLEQVFTDARLISPSNPTGHPERMTTAQLSLRYQIARDWLATVRVGYNYSSFLGTQRRDQAFRAGMAVFHEISRNLGVTLDYDFTRLISNLSASSFTRHAVTLGLTYRF